MFASQSNILSLLQPPIPHAPLLLHPAGVPLPLPVLHPLHAMFLSYLNCKINTNQSVNIGSLTVICQILFYADKKRLSVLDSLTITLVLFSPF
jgi:hypothetical protein